MTYSPYAELPLLEAARAVHNGRQARAESTKRLRAAILIDAARFQLSQHLPITHVSEILNGLTTDDVDVRDSGATAPLTVRGLRLVWGPNEFARLVAIESRESIDCRAEAEDLYAFIYAASIA